MWAQNVANKIWNCQSKKRR